MYIEMIEILSIPSAKCEAAGGAGVINIITKLSTQGFNGTASHKGSDAKSGAGLNQNYWISNVGKSAAHPQWEVNITLTGIISVNEWIDYRITISLPVIKNLH